MSLKEPCTMEPADTITFASRFDKFGDLVISIDTADGDGYTVFVNQRSVENIYNHLAKVLKSAEQDAWDDDAGEMES